MTRRVGERWRLWRRIDDKRGACQEGPIRDFVGWHILKKNMDMLTKKKTVARQAAARGPLPELPKELLDQLVKSPMTPVEV